MEDLRVRRLGSVGDKNWCYGVWTDTYRLGIVSVRKDSEQLYYGKILRNQYSIRVNGAIHSEMKDIEPAKVDERAREIAKRLGVKASREFNVPFVESI